ALQLAFPEPQVIAQAERLRDLMQGFLAYQVRAQPRQVSLGKLAEVLEELGRDHAVENAVAEELQPLVVRRAMAAVGESLREQLRPGKTVSDMLLETLPVHGPCRSADRTFDETRSPCIANYCCSRQNRSRR